MEPKEKSDNFSCSNFKGKMLQNTEILSKELDHSTPQCKSTRSLDAEGSSANIRRQISLGKIAGSTGIPNISSEFLGTTSISDELEWNAKVYESLTRVAASYPKIKNCFSKFFCEFDNSSEEVKLELVRFAKHVNENLYLYLIELKTKMSSEESRSDSMTVRELSEVAKRTGFFDNSTKSTERTGFFDSSTKSTEKFKVLRKYIDDMIVIVDWLEQVANLCELIKTKKAQLTRKETYIDTALISNKSFELLEKKVVSAYHRITEGFSKFFDEFDECSEEVKLELVRFAKHVNEDLYLYLFGMKTTNSEDLRSQIDKRSFFVSSTESSCLTPNLDSRENIEQMIAIVDRLEEAANLCDLIITRKVQLTRWTKK